MGNGRIDTNNLVVFGLGAMGKEDYPPIDFFEKVESSGLAPEGGRLGTETIDLALLVGDNLTQSGSFDLGGVRPSSFDRLLQALPIPAMLVDQSHTIIFTNQSCRKISVHGQAIVGESFGALFASAQVGERASELLDSVFRTRKATVSEAILDIDGKRVWGRLHLRTLRLGQERCILVIVEDISAEKKEIFLRNKHEQELCIARDELEKRVARRTVELRTANELLQREIAEREAANKLLQMEVSQRMKVEEELRTSLEEKEVLLGEIHHRVKNNLQMIVSLLGLQRRAVRDPKVAGALQDSQTRIRSMALVHEQLYRSGQLSRIDYRAYLQTLTDELMRSYFRDTMNVSLSMEVDQVYLGIRTALPCSLIISELIANCLKHAFYEGIKGQIRVELHQVPPNGYRLKVTDNGKGLPPGFDCRKSESLGLRLVSNLIDLQLHGTLEVLTDNRGSEFTIEFQDVDQSSSEGNRGDSHG